MTNAAEASTLKMPASTINHKEIPLKISAQVDVLYEALAKCPDLLQTGRRYGLRVGLTKAAADLMRDTHADEANMVVSNCLPIIDQ